MAEQNNMNKELLRYKKADLDDINIISFLAEKIWKKHYTDIITEEQIRYMLEKMYSEENLLQQMKEGQDFTMVYFEDIPAGFISISTKDKMNFFIHKFYIDLNCQGTGIGTQMLGYIFQTSLKNAHSVELTVNRKNYKSINFYFKNGFKIKEVADFDIGNGFFMNDFIMIKEFNESKDHRA
jgi:ribosomal protein S18 acetylase RimI-like enzyme